MPVLPGPPPVEVHLRRSARARRFSLRVSRLDGKVTLSMPLRAREGDAMAFLRGNEEWVRQTLSAMPGAALQAVGPGAVIPVEGEELVLAPATGRESGSRTGNCWCPAGPRRWALASRPG
jgi:predicted metal-dependent hydrolase